MIGFEKNTNYNFFMFPNPYLTTKEGLLAVGGNLEVNTLIEAYQLGIFPWPQEGLPLLWFSPDPRGVIDFSDLHIPKSFSKWKKKYFNEFKLTMNTSFQNVVYECRIQNRPGQKGSWILPEMEQAYFDLFQKGFGISAECWYENQLVAGVYGVKISSQGGVPFVSLESMFYKISNSSKLVLWYLIQNLIQQNYQWVDVQMITDVTSQFGGKYISRLEFLSRLKIEHEKTK
jgi:leucyl/phenylalanyl-tRNA--protein transferase